MSNAKMFVGVFEIEEKKKEWEKKKCVKMSMCMCSVNTVGNYEYLYARE